jgi:hypothetical protein
MPTARFDVRAGHGRTIGREIGLRNALLADCFDEHRSFKLGKEFSDSLVIRTNTSLGFDGASK